MAQSKRRDALRARIAELDARLRAVYGTPDGEPDDPLDALVETILSQNTSDRNSHAAFVALKTAYPTWESVVAAETGELAAVIKSGGLAQIKAGRIQRVLRKIAERGSLDIEYLRAMTPRDAERELLQLEGIGYKTARCVLLFAFEMEVFPVDTHVDRVLKRIGIIPTVKMPVDKVHEFMTDLVPEGAHYPFHVNLITHGRRVCHSQSPECPACAIADLCAWRGKAAG